MNLIGVFGSENDRRALVRLSSGRVVRLRVGDRLEGGQVAAIAGDQVDVETMYALNALMRDLGSTNMDCRQDGAKLDNAVRASYIFNSTIAGIEEADALLIVGTNPRWEAAVLNARIRKQWLTGGLKVGLIGEQLNLTYDYDYLGAGPDSLKELAAGKGDFAKVLKAAKRPMIILGAGAVARDDGAQVLAAAKKIADDFGMVSDDWNGFNLLQRSASRVGGLDIGFLPGEDGRDVAGILDGAAKGEVKVVYLLAADEVDMTLVAIGEPEVPGEREGAR